MKMNYYAALITKKTEFTTEDSASIPSIQCYCLSYGDTHDPGTFAAEMQELHDREKKEEDTDEVQKRMAAGVSVRLDYVYEDEASAIILFWAVINRMPVLEWNVKQNSWTDKKNWGADRQNEIRKREKFNFYYHYGINGVERSTLTYGKDRCSKQHSRSGRTTYYNSNIPI